MDGKPPSDTIGHLHRLVRLFHIQIDDGVLPNSPDISHFIAFLNDFLQERFGLADQTKLLDEGLTQLQAFHAQPVILGGLILLDVSLCLKGCQ